MRTVGLRLVDLLVANLYVVYRSLRKWYIQLRVYIILYHTSCNTHAQFLDQGAHLLTRSRTVLDGVKRSRGRTPVDVPLISRSHATPTEISLMLY